MRLAIIGGDEYSNFDYRGILNHEGHEEHEGKDGGDKKAWRFHSNTNVRV
jgi:hypothetical protein